MARYVTLKDSNGEALYPQIKADSIADGSVTSDKLDLTISTIGCTAFVGSSSASFSTTLRKISLGGGLVILMGSHQGAAPSVTAGSNIAIRVSTSTPLLSQVRGFSFNASQQSQVGSHAAYSVASTSTTLIDAYCYAPGTQTDFYFSYIIIGEEAS